MTENVEEPEDNIERLLVHLKANSLAEQLVKAWRDAEQGDGVNAIKAVIQNRQDELRGGFDGPKD